jgi:hypothetical protein
MSASPMLKPAPKLRQNTKSTNEKNTEQIKQNQSDYSTFKIMWRVVVYNIQTIWKIYLKDKSICN